MTTIITTQIQHQQVVAKGQQTHFQQQADQHKFQKEPIHMQTQQGTTNPIQGFQREHNMHKMTSIVDEESGENGVGGDHDAAERDENHEENPVVTVVDDHPHDPHPGARIRPTQATIDAVIADMFNFPEFENVYQPEFKRRKTNDSDQTAAATAEAPVTDNEEEAKFSDEAEITIGGDANTSFEDIMTTPAVVHRKRETKTKAKAARIERMPKQACNGCRIKFWKVQRVQQFHVCHNCVKIIQAIDATAAKYDGHTNVVRIDPVSIGIQVHCHAGHTWVTEFKAKQGQKWCRDCRKAENDQRK